MRHPFPSIHGSSPRLRRWADLPWRSPSDGERTRDRAGRLNLRGRRGRDLIYYAGGTTTKDISAQDIINDLKALGVNAYFVEDRKDLLSAMSPHFTEDCVLLLMGARDPSLEHFGQELFQQLKQPATKA